jgi:acyl-CoA dehydrogenase
VHVNIALIVKFMQNYFFEPAEMPVVGTRDDAANDAFLFDQGPTKGLGNIRFHDWREAFARFDLPNVAVFTEQAETLRSMLVDAPPTEAQTRDTDWLLSLGELFTLVVYGQLVLENAERYGTDSDVIDEFFDVAVRDFSGFAVDLLGKAGTSPEQAGFCRSMIRTPVHDAERYERVWRDHVLSLRDAYTMPR